MLHIDHKNIIFRIPLWFLYWVHIRSFPRENNCVPFLFIVFCHKLKQTLPHASSKIMHLVSIRLYDFSILAIFLSFSQIFQIVLCYTAIASNFIFFGMHHVHRKITIFWNLLWLLCQAHIRWISKSLTLFLFFI